MGIFLDLLIIFFLTVSVIFGFKNGVIRSFTSFVCTLLAIVISTYLADILSNFIYYNFINHLIVESINDYLYKYGTNNLTTNVNSIFNSFPPILLSVISFSGITSNSINQTINSTISNVGIEISNIVAPIIINFLKIISMSTIFMLCIFLSKIMTKNIYVISKLPILKQLDKLFGAVLGIIKCIIIMLFVMFIIKLFIPTLANVPLMLSDDTIESTFIFKHIYNNNPLYKYIINFNI